MKLVNTSGAVLFEDASTTYKETLAHAAKEHVNLAGLNAVSMDLSGLDLTGLYAPGANLSRANLDKTILAQAVLENADLTGATMRKAHAADINLTGAKADRLQAQGTDFTKAEMNRLTGKAINMSNCTLEFVQARQCRIEEIVLRNCLAAGSRWDESYMARADLQYIELTNGFALEIDGERANFRHANLHQSVLSGNLSGACFDECYMVDAEIRPFPESRLTGATFKNTVGVVAQWFEAAADDRQLPASKLTESLQLH